MPDTADSALNPAASLHPARHTPCPSETPPAVRDPYAKLKGEDKTGKVFKKFDIKPVPAGEALKKPEWIRVKAGSPATRFYEIKAILREHRLHTVCEEATCPNIGECFGNGTATFMIMGDKCTRRCPFCDVGHGRPDPLDTDEPQQSREDDRGTEAQLRRHHLGRSRRPQGRWRTALRRLHPRDARAVTGDADRGARARLPRPTRTSALDPRGRAARRDEPQPRDGAAAVPRVAPGFGLPAFADAAAGIQAACAGRADQERPDGRSRRNRRGDPAGDARPARARCRHADDRPVSGADQRTTCRCAAMCTRTCSGCSGRKPAKMGFTHAACGAMVRSSYHADQQAHAAGSVNSLSTRSARRRLRSVGR